jgi:hypothetical protein
VNAQLEALQKQLDEERNKNTQQTASHHNELASLRKQMEEQRAQQTRDSQAREEQVTQKWQNEVQGLKDAHAKELQTLKDDLQKVQAERSNAKAQVQSTIIAT